jgi:hypothetical protein
MAVVESPLGQRAPMVDNAGLHQWPEPLYVYLIV